METVKRYGYDIECFPNFFSVIFINTADREDKETFVIHKGINDIRKMLEFISQPHWFIGYNNSKYDDIILNWFLSTDKLLYAVPIEITTELYQLSQDIIKNSNSNKFYKANPTKSLSKFKHKYKSLDLMSVMAFDKLKVGLKQVSVQMKWHRLQDLPKPFDQPVLDGELEEIIDYNENDVLITLELLDTIIDEIRLRHSVSKQYGVDVMSSSRSQIGDKIMSKLYSDQSGLTYWEFKDLRDNNTTVKFSEIIWEDIVFETKPLQALMDRLKDITVVADKGNNDFKDVVILNDCRYTIAKGGLHSKMPPMIVEEDEDYELIDLDFGSFYPNIMINLNIIPPQLGESFLRVLKMITEQRLKAKADGDKTTADALKITINSLYGRLGFEYGYLYSPKCMYQVTVNGQLILLKLIELLEVQGFRCFYANTDGATFKVKRSDAKLFYEISDTFAEKVDIPVEYAHYKKCVIRDVNAYSIQTVDGKVKEKNLFSREIQLDKGYNMPVVSIALYEYFVNDIPIKDTIENHDNIYDYCKSQKVGKQYKIELHYLKDDKLQVDVCQKTNRYIVVNKGVKIYKRKVATDSLQELVAGRQVSLFNDYYESEDYDIDYGYYIRQTQKVIDLLEPQQLNLF